MKNTLVKLMMACIVGLTMCTGRASPTSAQSRSLDEQETEICRNIDELSVKLQKDGITDSLEEKICRQIEKLSDRNRQIACYRRLSTAVLSVRFEDVADFPIEEWTLPMIIQDIDKERARLKRVHLGVVYIISDVMNCSMLMMRMPTEEVWNPLLGMFEKMDAERRRLNVTDVAGYVHAMEMRELEFDSVLAHHVLPSDVEERLRTRFEKIVGRPLRSGKEVRAAWSQTSYEETLRQGREESRQKMKRMLEMREAYRKKMNLPSSAYIPEPGSGSWRELTGKKR